MKTNFTRLATFALLIGVNYSAFCQNWQTTGNIVTPGQFLGSQNNQPLNFRTNNVQRMTINHLAFGMPLVPFSAPPFNNLNTLPGTRLTRVGISYDGGNPIINPSSLLHLGATNGSSGLRDWMGIGVYIGMGNDHAFFGQRFKSPADLTGRPSLTGGAISGSNDNSDAVIGFGDNAVGPAGPGTDNLTFIHTDINFNANVNGPNFQNSRYGREIMRITGMGNVGIGPLFTDISQPQNMLHINNSVNLPTYLQITNATGTGQTNNDGFHFGLTNTGVGEIIQKENQDFRFYTNNIQRAVIKNNGFIGVNTNAPNNTMEIDAQGSSPIPLLPNGSSGLRFTRLTAANTPQANPGNGVLTVNANGDVIYANMPPLITANNGIIITPANVIQLGSNCNTSGAVQKSLEGIQNNRYLHLNGHNFIFGDGGRVGIGIPPANGGFQCNTVGNKLEIISTVGNPYFGTVNGASGLRFRLLTSADIPLANGTNSVDVTKVLSVDGNGDVVLVNTTTSLQANNGLKVTSNTVQLGGTCTNTAEVLASQLLTDRKIPLNGHNLIFTSFPTPGKGNVGFGDFNNAQCTPGNLVEIRNNQSISSSTSGLRLTDLAGATPLASNNQVLSINASGDVILTNAPTSTGSGFGNICSALQNPLTGDFEMPMATNKYLFTGQGLINATVQQDVVGIGYNCGVTNFPSAKLSVLNQQSGGPVTDETYAAYFTNNNVGSPSNNFGGALYAKYTTINQNFFAHNVGAVFEAYGAYNTIGAIGRTSKSIATGASFGGVNRKAVGLMGISDTICTVSGGLPNIVSNIGVYGYADQGVNGNYGVYGEANGTNNTGFNAGIYGIALPSNAGPGCGPNYAGYFNGDVVRIGNDNFTSDAILKQNIDTITNALAVIKLLKPRKFDYKQSTYPQMALPGGKQFGLIAQDVQLVLPEIVNQAKHPQTSIGSTTYAAVSYSTVEYQQLIPILIRAVQQLENKLHVADSVNAVQNNQLTALSNSINACCSNSTVRLTGISGGTITQQNVNLSDADVIVLNQNTPNPFAEQTTITYNVPAKYKFAQIIFKTIEGKIIRTVDVTTKGQGQLNVFANDLSAGLYLYTLIVYGQVIDSKKMVKE